MGGSENIPLTIPDTIPLPKEYMQPETWTLQPETLGPDPETRAANPDSVGHR